MQLTALEQLQSFIAELRARHHAVTQGVDESLSLVLADTVLLHALVRPRLAEFPREVVVIGPTQTGKSTVVNAILGQTVAEASPLAGHTRHPHGFTRQPVTTALRAAVDSLLPALRFATPETFDPAEPNAYTLRSIPVAQPITAEPCIVWDTPDFDSVSARTYRYAVPMMCGIADAIVVVVSREKYADQSVWALLRLIAPLRRPLIVCLNKSLPEVEAALREAITRKFEQEGIAHRYLLTLPWLASHDGGDLIQHPDAGALRTALSAALESRPTWDDPQVLGAFLRQHWAEWVAPLRAEHAAAARWRALVDAQTEAALERYAHDYLQQPLYDQTLQLAIARLLELLEIPGVATALARVRQTVTWPARTLWGYFKGRAASRAAPEVDEEGRVLTEIGHHLLLELQRAAGDTDDGAEAAAVWWRELRQRLQSHEAELRTAVQQGLEAHRRALAPALKAAAERLYEHLQAHPATLNSLRATRVTVDAAAIALALKTGGLGPNDLIFAPAMLAFTSMLTESAVGRYMNRVADELRERQRELVRQHLLDPLRDRLIQLGEGFTHPGLYHLAPERLAAAEHALQELV